MNGRLQGDNGLPYFDRKLSIDINTLYSSFDEVLTRLYSGKNLLKTHNKTLFYVQHALMSYMEDIESFEQAFETYKKTIAEKDGEIERLKRRLNKRVKLCNSLNRTRKYHKRILGVNDGDLYESDELVVFDRYCEHIANVCDMVDRNE